MRIIPLNSSDDDKSTGQPETADSNFEERVHLLSEDEDWAIKAALAASRPLLVSGEPGIGKTQLALAAAADLNRPLCRLTVDSRTEARELLFSFDPVARLAEAQVAQLIYGSDVEKLRAETAVNKFVKPGPMWWAINWKNALNQIQDHDPRPVAPRQWMENQGVVVLIDEIDKADSNVPNGQYCSAQDLRGGSRGEGRLRCWWSSSRVAQPLK
ncbi:MAG: AAA family ATPase [Planctomycetaceae bacterium]